MGVNQTCCCKCNKISNTVHPRRFVRRTMFNVSNSTIENKFVKGSGVGAKNRFARRALARRACSSKTCKPEEINNS
jgi:hypothetical protein